MTASSNKSSYGFDYDSIENGYYDEVYHLRKGIQSKWHHLKFAKFEQEMGTYDQHLDIGCGPGTFIGSLKEKGHSIGVDISDKQIAYANERYGAPNKKFLSFSPGPLPFDDNSFDVVTLIEVVEHLTEETIASVLKEIKRVLKPGGRFLLSTPNYHSPWPMIEILVNHLSKVSYAHQHITHFNRARLRTTLENAGFQNIFIEPFHMSAPFFAGFGWTVPDAVLKIEPRWLRNLFGLILFSSSKKVPGAA